VSDLEPLAPDEAVGLYLDARQDDATEKTIEGQKYRLRAFVQWCEEESVENLNELSGRDLYAYRVWRRDGGYSGEEIAPVTLHGDLATLRAFLWFCSDINAVPEELPDTVQLPTVNGDGEVSESTLDPDRAEAILEYLGRYHYASRMHTVLLILWHTGCRVSALRALDLRDLDLDGERPQSDGPGIEFVHRPDTDTPLKNKKRGERWNAISEYVADVIRDYVENRRPSVTDEHGRKPLIATKRGRNSRSNLRDILYKITRPCWYGEECPYDREPDECEAAIYYGSYSTCPSARSPHDVRSGRATYYALADVNRRVVSDRMDASEDILDKHYDRRSARRKSEQRRDHLPDS